METILIHKTTEQEKALIYAEISKQLRYKLESNPDYSGELCFEIDVTNPDLQVITTNVHSSFDVRESRFAGSYLQPRDPDEVRYSISLSPLIILDENGVEYQLDIDYNALARELSNEFSN
jgi:hypothetical protein